MEGGERYLSLYEYDRGAPLDADSRLEGEGGNFRVYKVYYSGHSGTRVPSLLVIPKSGTPPYPCIVFLHGYGGSKEDVLAIAPAAAGKGFAIFSVDAPYHGERAEAGDVYGPDLSFSKENFIRAVVDLRRGVDYLESRSDIDGSRIGYAGGSMGGIIGALFASIDERIKATVIVVGGGNLPLMAELSAHPAIASIREKVRNMGLDFRHLKGMMDPVDPINFIHLHARRPIQFHCGRFDDVVPAITQRQLVEKAGEPKEVYWYDAGHDLPLDIVLERALKFFEKHLGRWTHFPERKGARRRL